MVTPVDNYESWAVEQVWGSDRFYHEGDVAEDMYAFVIDSGISLNTNDLNVKQEWSKSFTSNPNPFDDTTGHGTAVASVIGAKANYQGLTGVAPGAQIVALKVFDNSSTNSATINNAVDYAIEVILENDLIDKSVINLSLGGRVPNNHPSVFRAAELGIKVSVSAGNNARDVDDHSPASYGDHPNVYTVSSNTEDGFYSGFTNFDDNDGVDDSDFTAPGSDIPTYNTDGTIRNRNGTSFSAPHVAGLLLMSDIKAGQTFEMSETQVEKGMVPDPLAMFDPETYKHNPEPIIIEVPVPEPYPVYVEVPVPVDPIIGKWDDKNRLEGTHEDDFILGGAERDIIKGRKGDDTILAFGGKNRVRGGEGSDTFYLDESGVTKVLDYDPLEDTIFIPGDYILVYNEETDNTKIYVEENLIGKVNGPHVMF